MIQKLKKSNAGFTLVELIVVIAILGVLAAVLVPQYIQYVEKSRASVDLATLDECLHAADTYYATQETTPTSITMAVSATGVITVGAALTDILGTTVTLKSNAANVAHASLVIVFDADGKAGWADSTETPPVPKTTATYFSAIATAA